MKCVRCDYTDALQDKDLCNYCLYSDHDSLKAYDDFVYKQKVQGWDRLFLGVCVIGCLAYSLFLDN